MFKFLIVLAFALRLILMPISAHSDLFFINAFPNLLITQNVFDIYSYFGQNLADRQYNYYPPLTYYTFGFFQFIYQFFSQSFSMWMTSLYELYAGNFSGQADDFIKAAPNPHLYRDIFLAKIPYLLFDIAAVVVILKTVKKRLLQRSAVLIWLFNPISLYSVYMMGQFEIIPAFFVLLGFLLMRKKIYWGFLLLGIAAAYKNYAFLFILPTLLIYSESWKKRPILLAISITPYFIFLLPTLIANTKEAVFALLPKVYLHYRKPLEGWPLYSQTIKYALLAISYLMILFLAYLLKIKDKWRFALGLGLTSLLLVYALAPRISFHYLLWATPLILLYFKNQKTALVLIIIQAVSLASYKLLANHLQAGLFAPINPDLFSRISTINGLIDQVIPYRIISATGFFIFFFTNLYFAAKIVGQFIFREEASQGQK